MVRIHARIGLSYDIGPQGADFIFNLQAARTAQQSVVWEQLDIKPFVFSVESFDPTLHNRTLRLTAPPGRLELDYRCTVDLRHHIERPQDVAEVPIAQLPPAVLPYLYPSRYCQSDCLGPLVMELFGQLPRGYSRVQAVLDWVGQQVSFKSNSSNSATSALDTLRDRAGVCRDFAHLFIALCRALNIPARFTTGTDYGADPILGPPDFHAYVEAYLGDRWYIFDPSGTAMPMGLVRFGTGRDAADVAFATIFGGVQSHAPVIHAWAVEDASQGIVLPYHCRDAMSTDGGHQLL